jgi:hypothetical protein
MMCNEFGLAWRKVIDKIGTEFMLCHPTNPWETYPRDFVEKRVTSKIDEFNFFVGM